MEVMDDGLGRRHRVEADLRCLMCGRLIGTVCGLVRQNPLEIRAERPTVHLSEFRPSTAGASAMPFSLNEQLRCRDCGGIGVLDEISVIPLRPADEPQLLAAVCPIHRERVRGPGRRPRGCECKQLPTAV
jgi:hypothetical protein